MKDPLQREATAYDVLGVARTATAADVDAAFKLGLVARRENVQRLTAAKRTLQQPPERALLDVFQYDPAALARLAPNVLSDPAALLPPRRARTAASWEARARERFPDLAATHCLAVLWYWQALDDDGGAGGPGDALAAPRESWPRAIACWAMLAASEGSFKGLPAELRSHVRAQAPERIRARLHDLEQAHRDGGRASFARLYQELELTLTTELRTAREVDAAGFLTPAGRLACGRLMLQRLGALEMMRSHVDSALGAAPGDPGLRSLRSSLSPYVAIRARLDADDPEGALAALDALAKDARASAEVRALRAEGLHRRARHQASVDQTAEALQSWEQALACGQPALEAEICREVVATCQARAAALQRDQRGQAIEVLEQGVRLVRSDALQATLAELLTQDAIERVNAQETEKGYTPAILAVYEKARTALERAAELGSARARLQAGPLRGLVTRARWSQKAAREVDFNMLPRPLRERFVRCTEGKEQPVPLHADNAPESNLGGYVAGALAPLGLGLLMAVGGYGKGTDPQGFDLAVYQAWSYLAGYVVLAFLSLWAVLAAVRMRLAARGAPYKLQRYLFPLDVVDARSGTLKIWPLRELTDFQVTRHLKNGAHAYSSLQLTLEGGRVATFVCAPRDAQALSEGLKAGEERIEAALQAGDLHAIACLDPFFDLHLGHAAPDRTPQDKVASSIRPPPSWLRWTSAAAAAAALVLMPPFWLARNVASDLAFFRSAAETNTVASLSAYASQGWLRKAAAHERLPPLLFEQARLTHSVKELRRLLVEYPGSAVAAQVPAAIHAVYGGALTRFRGLASSDRRSVAFMEGLLAHLEATAGDAVEVRFRPPDPDRLKSADLELSAKARRKGALLSPLAPHFANQARIEDLVVQGLAAAFQPVFPLEILHLQKGPPLAGALPAGAGPTIVIAYEVFPSGSFYGMDEARDPFVGWSAASVPTAYAGIALRFLVSMQVPGAAPPFQFELEVAPPDHFSVEGGGGDAVYASMTERAFDQLLDKLRAAFFRPAPAAAAPARGKRG